MKLKEIIKSSCEVICLDDVLSAIDSQEISQTVQAKIDKLIEYFNKVQDEMASEFIDVFATENVEANGEILFSNLSNQILNVVYIKDKSGKKITFTCYPNKVCFDGKSKEIKYTFVPEELDEISDDIVFLAPKRIYAYGIAREYFLYDGLLDKAEYFENRFKDSIKALLEKDKKDLVYKTIPQRKWL